MSAFEIRRRSSSRPRPPAPAPPPYYKLERQAVGMTCIRTGVDEYRHTQNMEGSLSQISNDLAWIRKVILVIIWIQVGSVAALFLLGLF